MAILIILIIALILYAAYKAPERQAHHYLSPEGMKIDWVLLQKDIGSDISKQQINQKMTRGAYKVLNYTLTSRTKYITAWATNPKN